MTGRTRNLLLIAVLVAVGLGLGAYLASGPNRTESTEAIIEGRAPTAHSPLVAQPETTPLPNLEGDRQVQPSATPSAPVVALKPDKVSEAFLAEHTAFLTKSLVLGPGQPERLRALLARYLPDRETLLKAAAAPDDDDAAVEVLLRGAEAMRELRRSGRFADEVRAMLRPDQQTQWDASLQKMALDDAEVVSARELATIQARLPLTEKQKDEMYRTLHEIARLEQAESGVTLQNPERDEQQVTKRLEALSPLVSDAEKKALLRALESASAERWFLPLEPLDVFDGVDGNP